MNKMSKVEEFKTAKAAIFIDVVAHVESHYGVMDSDEDKVDPKTMAMMKTDIKTAVQDKTALLEDLRKLEPVAALEECRDALSFAEQIAKGSEAKAQFEIRLDFVRCENVKPGQAEEAAELAEKCTPFLAELDKQLEDLRVRIEYAEDKSQDDPAALEKIEELKQWREVAIIEGRETNNIDDEILTIQRELDDHKRVAALALEEAEILRRHAEKVQERRDAVAHIQSHIAGVGHALKAYVVADHCNKTAEKLAELVQELDELRKTGAGVQVRFPRPVYPRYTFNIPRIEGCVSRVDEWGRYSSDHWYNNNDGGRFVAKIDAF